MGRPKPLLRFGDQALLARLLREARRSSADVTIVVLGHEADRIGREVDLSGVRVVHNE